MGTTQVFLSSATMCGTPYNLAFELIKKLGFDGVELLLTNRVIRHRENILYGAFQHQLETTLHRWWHGPELSSRILTRLHIFPKEGVRIKDVLPRDDFQQVVVSTYSWDERVDNYKIMIQPAPTGYAGDVMPFEEIRQKLMQEEVPLMHWAQALGACMGQNILDPEVQGMANRMASATRKHRVAFDVGHWCQYRFYPGAMPADSHVLLNTALDGFVDLQSQIDEIHIYDFRPDTKGGVAGINLFPGDGIFPIAEFLKSVKTLGWAGRIVWEIHPLVILKNLWRPRWLWQRLKELPQFTRAILD